MAAAAAALPAGLVGDVCAFFDRMADLVDPRLYYDSDRAHVNLRVLK